MKNSILKVGTIASLVMAMAAPAVMPNVVFAQVGDVRQEDRRADRQQDRQADRREDRQADRQQDRQADRQQDRQMERQQDRQMDRQADRQRFQNLGAQTDVRFQLLTLQPLTLSIGYARAWNRNHLSGAEWMASLKLL